jgi:hypothetical protein
VLFLVFGASAAGKTIALDALRGRLADLAIHDFDEVGVPSDADKTWRQRSDEVWVGRALDYQAQGVDLLLAGQTPLGELLASPSAPLLEAVSACLIDCDEPTRSARLRARGAALSGRSAGDPQWLRRHAEDPAWCPEVIREGASHELRWERWSSWQRGDPRWRVRVIDTTSLPVEQVADELAAWIDEERALVRSGEHPLQSFDRR